MKKYLLIISVFISVIGGITIWREYRAKGPVYGEGGIEVAYEHTPLFNFANIAPGQSVAGRVTVKSTSGIHQNVGLKLRSGKISDILTLGKFALKIRDVDTNNIIFGGTDGKKLLNLFISPKETQLFTINPGQTRTLDLIIAMDPQSSNFYQGRSLNFDISLGFIASGRFSR